MRSTCWPGAESSACCLLPPRMLHSTAAPTPPAPAAELRDQLTPLVTRAQESVSPPHLCTPLPGPIALFQPDTHYTTHPPAPRRPGSLTRARNPVSKPQPLAALCSRNAASWESLINPEAASSREPNRAGRPRPWHKERQRSADLPSRPPQMPCFAPPPRTAVPHPEGTHGVPRG